MVTVISLFAGCGGSSLGYKWAGYNELLAVDFEKNAVETFKLNFPDIPVWEKDIKQVIGKEILKFCKIKKGQLDVLDGSPPCQGFSTAGKFNVNDIRNDLFKEYVRLINDLQPKVFVMENVSGMIKGKMKGKFIEIITTLKSLNYQVKCKRLNSMWYNVPQSRERLIFIGVRNDLNLQPVFPKPNKNFIKFKDAVKECNGEMPPKLSKMFKDIIPQMKQGQSCDDIKKGKGHQTFRIFENKVCPTITKIIGGIGFGALIHPTENRVLSISEIKRVCSFPDNFKFIGKYQEQKARMGNAVMPKFMQAIAETIKNEILLTLPLHQQ